MLSYQLYRRGETPVGSIVVKLYQVGNRIRGFVRKIEEVDEDGTAFPSEELEPGAALRLAEETRQGGQAIFIEFAEGVEWNPNWGSIP
jgi:hypothetical protein